MVFNNGLEKAKPFISKLAVKGLVRAGMTQEQWWKCRQCTACCISCKRCYCMYLTRIPVCSIIAIFWLVIGFTGFAYGMHQGVEGLKLWLKMEILDLAQTGLMAMGIFFGVVSFLAFLNGVAATGRTRFNVYSGWKSKCAGRCCIFWLMLWHLFLWFLWMFLAPLMIFPVIFMGIFFAVCQVKLVKQLGKTCIEFAEYGLDDIVNTERVCGAELIDFCAAMTSATPYFVAGFVGGIFIVVGVFIMTLVLAANYVHVKNHMKREMDSECSICRKCCTVPDPEFYDECWPEPPVEEVQLSMREKLKLNHGDNSGTNPHGQETWTYVYDFDQDPGKALKKY